MFPFFYSGITSLRSTNLKGGERSAPYPISFLVKREMIASRLVLMPTGT